jgi:hypothetical protein
MKKAKFILPQMREFKQITGVGPKFDGLMSIATGGQQIDIIQLDKDLSANDPEYDSEACTYKGEEMSMGEYLSAKFGPRAYHLVEEMLK